MSKIGTIYQLENGQVAVGFKKEQPDGLSKIKRVFLRYYDDLQCNTPTIYNGKKVKGIRHLRDIRVIGFITKSNTIKFLSDLKT